MVVEDRDIVFEYSNRQSEHYNAMPAYVVVEFPNSNISNANKCFQNQGPN